MRTLLRALSAALLFALSGPGCVEEGDVGSDEQDATEATGRFETWSGDDGKTYFHLLSKNGESVLSSQGYASLSGAKSGITSVRKNGGDKARYKINQADNGEFYFNLVATNGQVIGTSELYVSSPNAERGVDAVIAALVNATSASAATSGPRFETLKGTDGKTYFHLRATNGQIVLQSQGYSSKSAADGGIASVKTNAVDATNFKVFEGVSGQHTWNLVAANGQVIGRGEMYASKSNALTSASRVHDIVRELAGAGAATDAQIQAEIEEAASGLWYTSESDYPFMFVSAALSSADAPITESVVREAFAAIVDGDPDTDKPMANLVAMSKTWEEWKASTHSCHDNSDPDSLAACMKMRNFETVIEANLNDLQIFYFGADGAPGDVQGTGVSIFILGRSPSGNLVGVRTIAIWT